MKEYRVGIDIGSTTVKLVVLGCNDEIVFSEYRRHQANTQLVLSQLLREAEDRLGQCGFRLKITGSGSINLAKALELEFIQEVVAVAAALLARLGCALVYGDLFMRCVYRLRPYEKEKGSVNALHAKLKQQVIRELTGNFSFAAHRRLCRSIVEEFDRVPIIEGLKKPRVGVVGEILVKYMPLANNHIVELLEREGAEAVVPDLADFLNYSFYNGEYRHRFLGAPFKTKLASQLAVAAIRAVRLPALQALEDSRRFSSPLPIAEVAELAKPFLSLGNQYGEGWFLTGEMAELLREGVDNIVCIQPFACLPNHVVGKGAIKALKASYPRANIVAVDYDPGASEVNQLNRIKLMLSTAKERLGG